MMYWAGLYPPELQGKILEGVKTLLACVHRAVALCNLTTFQGSDPQGLKRTRLRRKLMVDLFAVVF